MKTSQSIPVKRKIAHTKKNHIPSHLCRRIARVCRLQCFATWRFHLVSVIFAFLLSATATRAATITVTNGNDSASGSLRQAILDALSGDTINFAAGVTTVNLTSNELVIDKNLTISGPGAHHLTIRRTTNAPEFRIFHITSSTVTVSISGLTISRGSVSEPDGDGGGIRSAGVLTLADCIVSGNQAYGTEILGGTGGGILNDHGTMGITRCTINNNSAQYSTGSSGDCPSGSGGGILNDSGSMNITNSTISGNSCVSDDDFGLCYGGGSGGGISNAGSMTITDCTISGNSGTGTGSATMDGGGISNFGNLQIESSTIAHNSASGDNGASGGGIYGSGQTIINSSILALNSAPTGPDFTGGRVLNSSGYNIIGNHADAVISSQTTDQIGTPGAPIDPRLGSLANNGGPTFTHPLQPGSPAINRGSSNSPPQDQRHYTRVGVPDVGAFEFGGAPVPIAGTNAATNVASFAATLSGTVNPNGLTTAVHFQYGPTTSYGSTTATQTFAGSTTHNVIANIAGLSASTRYHFRIVATNTHGTRYSSDRIFTTLSPIGSPVVYTNPATLIASFSATLNGTVDPHGLTTSVHFEYGTTSSYGLTTAPQSKSGNTYQNVSANISGLIASTTYHFRIVATNSAGTSHGADRTFTTP